MPLAQKGILVKAEEGQGGATGEPERAEYLPLAGCCATKRGCLGLLSGKRLPLHLTCLMYFIKTEATKTLRSPGKGRSFIFSRPSKFPNMGY